MASRQKTLVKNTAILLVGKIFTQFLSFFMLPLYTRLLPASDYGLVDLLLTYITLAAPVVTVQQEMATFRFLIDARDNEKEKAHIIKTSFKNSVMRLLSFIIPCLIVALFVKWHYLYLILIAGISVSLSGLFLQISRGLGDNTKYSIAAVISGITTISSNLLLICVFHFGAESILISMALANIVCGLFLIFALRIPYYFGLANTDKKLKKEMLKYSWPLVPNGISWWMINASDRTIVSIILGTAANGIYAVALKFPSIISSFLGIFVMSWTESASVHINDKDRDQFFSSIASNTIRIFSSLSILVIAAMPFAFNIIIGEEYRDAYVYIPIAILGVLMNCMVSVYSAIYVAKKMTKQVASTSVMSAIINIVVDLALVYFVGLYAAVISTAVAFAAMAIYRHYDLKKYVKIKYRASDIILAAAGFVIVSTLYYLGNFYGFVMGAIFAILYTVVINRRIIRKTTKRIGRIFYRGN